MDGYLSGILFKPPKCSGGNDICVWLCVVMTTRIFLHDDLGLCNVGRNGLVRQDRATVDVDLILDSDIVTQY